VEGKGYREGIIEGEYGGNIMICVENGKMRIYFKKGVGDKGE
jgi:hypothetical protein